MPTQMDKLSHNPPNLFASNDPYFTNDAIALNPENRRYVEQNRQPSINHLNSKPIQLNPSTYDFPPAHTEESLERDRIFEQANYESRLIEISRFITGLFHAPFLYIAQADVNFGDPQDPAAELGLVIGNGGGLLMAFVANYFLKNILKNNNSLNPMYRVFKTMASVGLLIATGVNTYLQPSFLSFLLIDIISLSLGAIVALLYWSIRHLVLKIPNFKYRNVDAMVGYSEGWTRYGKLVLVCGMYVGMVVGAIIAGITGTSLKTDMTLWGAIIGVGAFAITLVLVPLINKFFNKKLVCLEKDNFRTNYVRSGITLFLALGTIVGFFVGTGTALGAAPGMLLFGAIFSVIGGLVLGLLGKNISAYTHKHWNLTSTSDNSFDFAARNMAYVLAYLGVAIGFIIAGPAGIPLGYAIGNAIGWFLGVSILKEARRQYPIEVSVRNLPTPILPCSQRGARGASVGATVFMALGFAMGFLIGGSSMAYDGATIGFGLGGFIGGLIGGLYHYRTIVAAAKALNAPKQEEIATTDSVVSPTQMLSVVEEPAPQIPILNTTPTPTTKNIPIQAGIYIPAPLTIITTSSVLSNLYNLPSTTEVDSCSTSGAFFTHRKSYSDTTENKRKTSFDSFTGTPTSSRQNSFFFDSDGGALTTKAVENIAAKTSMTVIPV